MTMTRAMAVFACACAFSLTVPAADVRAQDDDAPPSVEARITSVDGEVTVLYHDHGEDWVAADEDAPLEPGDMLKTGGGAHAEICLDGDSVIELGSDSQLEITDLARKEPVFSLSVGSLLAKIRSLVKAKRSLSVRTTNAVASVRGTEFGVETGGPDGLTYVAVFNEGRVEVRDVGGMGRATVWENQETTVREGEKPSPPKSLDRFAAHRVRVQNLRARVKQLKEDWEPASRETRAETRLLLREWGGKLQKKLHSKLSGRKLSPEERERIRDKIRREFREERRREQQHREAGPKRSPSSRRN